MLWLYDGGWEGLLSAVFQVYVHKDVDDGEILPEERFSGYSMFPVRKVSTNAEQARRVARGMERLSRELPRAAYRAFLSEQPDREGALLGTLRLGFSQGQDPLTQLMHEPVHKLATLSRRVANEERLFLGLVRLSHAGGDLYVSDIEPKYNILPLMGHHFHTRFGDQRLVIRDVRRRIALLSTPEEWWISELPQSEGDPLPPLPRDAEMAALWRSYFQAIANPARKNPRLQQHFVPLRYRGHVAEFQEKP